MTSVLTFLNYYLPGFRGGGPGRSIANLVLHLGPDVEFRIVTSDRDCGDSRPYAGISSNRWHRIGPADVCYASRGALLNVRFLCKLLRDERYDTLYLNSFFDPIFTILPLIVSKLLFSHCKKRVIIAPRGELAKGALGIKPLRKRAWLRFARRCGLYSSVVWQAASDHERNNIIEHFGQNADIHAVPIVLAPDLIGPADEWCCAAPRTKRPGQLNICFVGRITRIKNIEFISQVLRNVTGEISLSIYGPIQDNAYWRHCLRSFSELPANVNVTYGGAVPHTIVDQVFKENHLFFLPSLGESFGHVIGESLRSGCPVLISDQTPWRGVVEFGAGWAFPLSEASRFRDIIDLVVKMPQGEYDSLACRAAVLGLASYDFQEALRLNASLFRRAAS